MDRITGLWCHGVALKWSVGRWALCRKADAANVSYGGKADMPPPPPFTKCGQTACNALGAEPNRTLAGL